MFINGRSALKGFSSGSFDLCILDIMMPEMDGLALAKELRYIEPAIQIIFLTAKTQLLTYKDLSIKLTTKESELLELLSCHRNEILERNYALRTIWIDDNYFNARSMDVYISRLRKYLKTDTNIRILNIHGKGYKLIC